MGNQQPLKLFLALLISTVYIFSFSQLGALAYNAFSGSKNYFAEGTIIGNLPVAGKTEEEAKKLVDEEISKWLANTTITVQYLGKSKTLDLSYIQFDSEASVSQAQHGIKNLVVADISSLNDFLKSLYPSINLEEFNVKALENEILNSAAVLEPGDYQYRVENFNISVSLQEDAVIKESPIVLNPQNDELEAFAGKTLKIEPKAHFSLLNSLKEEGLDTLPGQALNKIASAVYTVILPTNFTVLERHISNTLPAYAALGLEAKVDPAKNFDLAFSNPNDSEYAIQFTKKDQSLIVSLTGPEFLNEYVITMEEEKSFEPKTIVQYSPLKKGKQVKSEGIKGLYIKVYRESHDQSGDLLQKMLISEDFYAPVHRVEIHPLRDDADGTGSDDEQTGGENGTDKDQDEKGENNGGEDESGDERSDDDLWGSPNEIPKR